MPPAFSAEQIADYFNRLAEQAYLSTGIREAVRPAQYNASKRGMTRRVFSIVHPVTAHDSAEFISSRWTEISDFLDLSLFSISKPKIDESENRSLSITPHNQIPQFKRRYLSRYRFVVATDISRFYHSIYTHSIPWAVHGKERSKADIRANSKEIYLNRADKVIRFGQDGQTIGIPVGPDSSRVFAEIVATGIDLNFQDRCRIGRYSAVRHVDDIWIGANSYDDAEDLLSRYREAMREFELDINESKTRIYGREFSFSDQWPVEIASSVDLALASRRQRVDERLEAALENGFLSAVSNDDDAIIKYLIGYLDSTDAKLNRWDVMEPFLIRSAVHFGHAMDYITQMLIWRHRVVGDVDLRQWGAILNSAIAENAKLGNDSEVCWAIYSCIALRIRVRKEVATVVATNCGASSLLAILNCADVNLAHGSVFSIANERLLGESARGPFWPVLMEWGVRKWPGYKGLSTEQEIIDGMVESEVTMFNVQNIDSQFQTDSEELRYGRAIESRSGDYDDIEEYDDMDEFPF